MGLIYPKSVGGSPIIRPGLVAPVGLILDQVTGCAGAYSLRKIKANYAGSAIRVRRSNDNQQADIGFDNNGNLNLSALLAHTGANSGFVTTWYDQSGNGYNATQGTAANQPRIVNAGTVHMQNSLPSVQFNGSAWYLALSGTALTMAKNVAGFTSLIVMQGNNTSVTQGAFNIHAGATSSNGRMSLVKNSSNRIQAVAKALDTDTGIFASNAVDSAALTNWTGWVDYTLPNCFLYKANVSQGNATSASTAGNTQNTDSLAIFIGCRGNGTSPQQYWNGHISELLFYPVAMDATNRGLLYTSQGTYYGV